MKRAIVLLVFIVILLTPLLGLAERNFELSDVSIEINGVRLVLVNENNEILQCIESDGDFYVPFKSFVESIGGNYSYESESGKIAITLGNNNPTETITQSGSEPSKQEVKITAENFQDYFSVSISTSGGTSRKVTNLFGMVEYDCSENVDIVVTAREPFEIHNVTFEVEAFLSTGFDDFRPVFSDVMPQSGSYEASKSTSWHSIIAGRDHMGIISVSIKKANGVIIIQ